MNLYKGARQSQQLFLSAIYLFLRNLPVLNFKMAKEGEMS